MAKNKFKQTTNQKGKPKAILGNRRHTHGKPRYRKANRRPTEGKAGYRQLPESKPYRCVALSVLGGGGAGTVHEKLLSLSACTVVFVRSREVATGSARSVRHKWASEDLRFAQVATTILSMIPVAAVMPVAVVMLALPRVVLPRWLSVAGADEDAPDIGLVSSPTLQPGVYRRVVAGTLQMYICLGSVEHFIQEVTHLPAGPYQPLAMQVAVLHEFPVNEVVVSNGTRPLWSDDVVICPFHDELRVLVTVSSAGVGERPTELPTQPPQIIPGGGGHRASDANSTSTSCAAASHIMVSGDEVTSKRRRRD